MARHNQVGRWGEDIACNKLISEGYAILARNWKMLHYELDIIAMKGTRIVFVEVKTRTSRDEDPFMALTRGKLRRTIAAGVAYVKTYNIRHDIQFDFIGINGTPDDFEMVHIPDAITPQLKTYR